MIFYAVLLLPVTDLLQILTEIFCEALLRQGHLNMQVQHQILSCNPSVSAFKQRICFICSPKFCRTDKLAYQISCVTTDWKTDMETWFFQYQDWARGSYTILNDIDENELKKPSLHGIHTTHSGNHRNSQNIYKFLKIIHCTCKTYSISRKQNRATAFFYLVQNLLNDIL